MFLIVVTEIFGLIDLLSSRSSGGMPANTHFPEYTGLLAGLSFPANGELYWKHAGESGIHP